MNLKGEPAFVGRHCGANEYQVTPDGVAFYADALDERSLLHERVAPPLLYHSECYRFVGEWYLKNLFGNLHARQQWWMFGAIPVGARVRSRSTIVERYTRRGRDYVVNETDFCDAADGRLLVRGRTHQSFLPPRGASGGDDYVVDETTPARKAPRPPFPTAAGAELAPAKHTVDARRCWMFSGPGRNYHTDAEEARKLGFPRIVVQGMMSTCFVSQVMQAHFGMGWVQGGAMDVKLINVLWADETVTARARVREEVREGSRTRVHCDVWIEKDEGTRILIGDASAIAQ